MDEVRVICVIENGCLIDVYSNTKNMTVDLLDYDNMNACIPEDKDDVVAYSEYKSLEEEIKSGKLHRVW